MGVDINVVSDSLHIGNWRAYRDHKTATATGPANEPMPDIIAVFLGRPARLPAYGSTRAPLPAADRRGDA